MTLLQGFFILMLLVVALLILVVGPFYLLYVLFYLGASSVDAAETQSRGSGSAAVDLEKPDAKTSSRWIIPILGVMAGFVVLYHLLTITRLDRSAAMFIGVPMLIGLYAALARPRDAVGSAFRYTTICLCLVAPLLGEGVVCLVMAAPIVYLVAAMVGHAFGEGRNDRLRAVVLLPFVYAVASQRPLEEREPVEVSTSIEIQADEDAVWNGISRLNLPLEAGLPLFLRLGFPRPLAIVGEGMAVGAERRVVFDRGTVLVRVVELDAGRYARVALSYEDVGREFIDRWIALEEATFTFTPLPDGRTRLTHTTRYRRLLEPGFYFAPVEQYGVNRMQAYLLESFRDYLRKPYALR